MTDKEAMKLALEALELLTDTEQTFGALDYGDNAITALKEALAQPEQAPVATVIGWGDGGQLIVTVRSMNQIIDRNQPLYLHPPQRTEQEPCVHAKNPKGCYRVRCQLGDKCVDDEMSFRTTPPQRKPLTHDELTDIWYKQSLDWMEFARAVEAAHGIKENT